jgi:uncharacterized protein YhaN
MMVFKKSRSRIQRMAPSMHNLQSERQKSSAQRSALDLFAQAALETADPDFKADGRAARLAP